MWGFIVALISGALMSIQGVFNTEVTKQTAFGYRPAGCSCQLLQSVFWPGFSQDGKVWLHSGRWTINIHFLAE